MALGYEIGPILKRKSIVHSDGVLSIKQDTIEKLGNQFKRMCFDLVISRLRQVYSNSWKRSCSGERSCKEVGTRWNLYSPKLH